MRRRRVRRFLTMAIIVTIFVYAAHTTYAHRMNMLEEVKAELAGYQEQYDDVMLRQGYYENQIIRLEDEDYIAMFARERFQSLPGEIVFRIVDDSMHATEITDESLSEDRQDEN